MVAKYFLHTTFVLLYNSGSVTLSLENFVQILFNFDIIMSLHGIFFVFTRDRG